MTQKIILASTSIFRKALLENAGVAFDAEAAQIDERTVEQAMGGSGATPSDIAQVLAEAKATDVAERISGALVIGCDQTLELEGEMFHKPEDMEEARRNLLRLSGKTHQLHSAVTIVRGAEVIWRHVSTATMTMRDLDPGFVGRYLAHTGPIALKSGGCYQYEGRGIQLFDKVNGDYFTIVGLPMLPLLKELRQLGAIDG